MLINNLHPSTLASHIKPIVVSVALLIGIIFSHCASACGLLLPLNEQDGLASPLYGQELGCLAMNVYQEARGEPKKGMLAVAAVTMNRVNSKNYPNTVCEVVWQNKQFSWTGLKTKYHVITNQEAWVSALKLAELAMNNDNMTRVGNATHYHAASVSPSWKDEDRIITQVGNHIFYAL